MKIIDSHAHLMDEMYKEDIDEVLKRCIENDLEYVINIGYSKETSQEAIEFANKYDWIYAVVGMHPDECNTKNADISFIKDYAKNKKVVAIGEIGLDYHYPETNKETQKEFFIRQIQLANELSLPVVIHNRDADMDMLEILKENKINKNFVMHCFSSSLEVAKEIIKMDGYISLSGTVTFKNAKKLIEVAKIIPEDRLLIETDCPYLTPEPNRGKRNEPKNVWDTLRKISEIRNINVEELAYITNRNTKKLIALLPRKCILNSFFCSEAGIPIPVSFTSILQVSSVSEVKTCTLPPSGVYFSALDMIFFKMESILSLSNHTFR